MACTIVLYGATGYSGGLIVTELKNLREGAPGRYRLVLAGRDADRLKALADAAGMEYSAFGLDDDQQLQRALGDLGANVVINAAGPFATTACCLARAAIELGCHYVDINGEADVYRQLDDLRTRARTRKAALVGSAGFWAAASNLLLDTALEALANVPATANRELGAIRIAMSRIETFSRGSAATVWQSLRREVTVVRKGRTRTDPDRDALLLCQEPVGKLERSFNFGTSTRADRRIASAASLVDTLAARWTLVDLGKSVRAIESYVEAGLARRMTYQLGAWLAPLVAVPAVRALAQQPAALLADGPTRSERRDARHVIVLEIEDSFRSIVVDWRWETPNVYQLTAHLVVAVAAQVGAGGLKGWLTPGEVLRPLGLQLTASKGPLRGCKLERRRG